MDEVKRELVREWLKKASRDLTVAKIVARSPEAIWEASLYHCQQAAEKALKKQMMVQMPRTSQIPSTKRESS